MNSGKHLCLKLSLPCMKRYSTCCRNLHVSIVCFTSKSLTYISLFLKANTNNVDVNQRGIEIRVGVEGWGGRVTMATRRPTWTIDAHSHHTLGHADPLSPCVSVALILQKLQRTFHILINCNIVFY